MFQNQQAILTYIFPSSSSDHWPIMLAWESSLKHIPNPFRFEQFWMEHLDFMENVRSWWVE